MKCQHAGCNGTIEDGFCDVCGKAPAPAAVSAAASRATSPAGTYVS